MISILFYNSFFDAAPALENIAPEIRPFFSLDKNTLSKADAVVFHVPDLGFGKPDVNDIISLKKKPAKFGWLGQWKAQ